MNWINSVLFSGSGDRNFFVDIFFISIVAGVALWIYKDARKRHMKAIFWAYGSIFFPVLSWIIYFSVRTPLEPCSDCRKRSMAAHFICRNCHYNFSSIALKRGLINGKKDS